jgi:hypothetical protein
MIEQLVSPERVAQMEYYLKETPRIDWQWMFVIGILIGAFIAAITSGSFRWRAVPDMWAKNFGPAIAPRAVTAFIGGMIAMFGARLADG